jgi:ABC-type transport system involved in multi-copper enzyme maturation permease subunit
MRLIGRWFWRLGPGNPMAVRIVEGGSRRTAHLWVRAGYLGLLVGLVLVGLLSAGALGGAVSMTQLAQSGAMVLALIAYGQVILVCLLAPLFMAGAIASEQSGKTYNILLTTPLSNLQIVLGSLMGRLFFVLALLLSGLPLFAVVLVFGGVRPATVGVAFAVAACTAVFVGSVAVTLSVLRAAGRKAVYTFVIAIAGYLIGAYLLDRGLLRALDPSPFTTWLTPLHPLLVLESSLLSESYRPPTPEVLATSPSWVAWYLGQPLAVFATWTLGSSLAMMLGCSIFIRRMGQGEGRWLGQLKTAMRLGRATTRPGREVTGNPIAWREANTRGKVVSGILARWVYVGLGVLSGAGLLWAYHFDALPKLPAEGGGLRPRHEVFHLALTLLLSIEVAIVTLVALYMSAGCVSREREDGTLDIMLTTPISPRQYVWGKLRGLVKFLSLLIAVPVVTLIAASVYAWIGKLQGWSGSTFTYYINLSAGNFGGGTTSGGGGGSVPGTPLLLPEAGVLLALMLVPFIAICIASGMAWSLKAKGVAGAVVPTVGIVGAAVAVLGLCGWSAAGAMPLIGPIVNGFSPATSAAMLVNPWDRVDGFAESPVFGRFSLVMAGLIAAGTYSLIVYAMIVGMVKGFDQTVRRLSGTG